MANIGDTGTLAGLDVREGDVVEQYPVEQYPSCIRYVVKHGPDGMRLWDMKRRQWGVRVKNSTAIYTLIARAAPPIWRDMTAEQKLVIALAKIAGKQIEWLNRDGIWLKTRFDSPQDDIAYRVRPPEPVVETVTLYCNAFDGWQGIEERADCDTHTITFTIRDGEPDCDSIKMEEL